MRLQVMQAPYDFFFAWGAVMGPVKLLKDCGLLHVPAHLLLCSVRWDLLLATNVEACHQEYLYAPASVLHVASVRLVGCCVGMLSSVGMIGGIIAGCVHNHGVFCCCWQRSAVQYVLNIRCRTLVICATLFSLASYVCHPHSHKHMLLYIWTHANTHMDTWHAMTRQIHTCRLPNTQEPI